MIPACSPPRPVTRPKVPLPPNACDTHALVWGGDWPHPRVEGEMPDGGHLLELFQAWTPDKATQQRILVDNPARLYGFPN